MKAESLFDFWCGLLSLPWRWRSVVNHYRSYGLPATYKPVNDVVINGRKASGNGATELHNSMALIGNVIMDFNAEEISKVLRVPDVKLRDRLAKSMEE